MGQAKAAALLIGILVSGCASTVQWRYYAPFRSIGRANVVSPVDPAEVSYAGVASKLHYVSLVLDGVFFRNLPKTMGKKVVLGISLSGALAKRPIKTVTKPVTAMGANGLLYFERPLVIDPFLYRGTPLRLTLTFRVVGRAESVNLLGRIAALGASKLIPGNTRKLAQHAEQFEAFLGGDYKGEVYTYTFSLYPSDMEGVRQDLILTGGRHVYIGIPARSAPGTIRKLRPADVAYKLEIAGRRLQWRHDQREYTDSPYLLLSVIRYKRYPSDEIGVRKAEKQVDRFIEEENWKLAKNSLADVGTALLDEKTITQMERNLIQAQRDVRAARIAVGLAAKEGKRKAQLKAMLRQIKLLGFIGKDFQQILEPAEVKDILFRVRRLSRQARELSGEAGTLGPQVEQVFKAAVASIRLPPEPPRNPSLSLKPPDVVKVVVTRPEPFYKKWWFYTLVGAAAAGLATGSAVIAAQGSDDVSGPPVLLDGKRR